MRARREHEISSGWREPIADAWPVCTFYIVFGATFGVMAHAAGWSFAAVAAASGLVYSGAAQFALIGLEQQGAGVAAVATTLAVLSLRHLTFTTALGRELAALDPLPRWLTTLGLTDEAFGLAAVRQKRVGPDAWYLARVAALLWPSWSVGSWAGWLLAGAVPALGASGTFQIAFPALFIGLATPLARAGNLRVALAAAAAVWLLGTVAAEGPALILAVAVAPLLALWRRS